MLDVLVAGAGPAGRALAAACGERGLRTALIDPAPDRPWRATYADWAHELPADLPRELVAATGRGLAFALTRHELGRDYAVLDVPALRRHLDGRLARAGVPVLPGRAAADAPRSAVVVDAGGPAQPLSTRRHPGPRAAQSAVGVVVDRRRAAPWVGDGEALFMDWRPVPGEPADDPTFLYAVPLGADRVLLEETSLARRPGLPARVLRRRLHARLAAHGVDPAGACGEEVVHFPLDLPRHRGDGVLGFGAAAPLTHPATGYQLATALRLAGPVAEALADGLAATPARAIARATAVVWSRPSRLTHAIRRRGLESLLRLPPRLLPVFFEGFFQLPEPARWDYLGARDDPPATVAAMAGVFRTTDWELRLRLIGSSLLVRAPADWSVRSSVE